MRPLTPAELSRMRGFSEAQMLDTGRVLKRTVGSRDTRGQPPATFTAQAPIACTFVITTQREALSESSGAAITDAVVYVPLDTVIGPQDRFQLTHRFGQALTTPITYAVIGQPAPDIATLRVGLRSGEASQ
jgi:hypothetical protein